MKRMMISTLLAATMIFLMVSCSPNLKSMDDGDINYNIYPYLKLELSPSSDSYIAYVVEGAKVTSISIPGERHTPFGAMPVNVFKGFKNPEDAANLKVVYIDINVEEIAPEAFIFAGSLEKIVTTGIEDGQNWAKLPSRMYREGCHFHGWKIGETVYKGGDKIPLSSDTSEAEPNFEVLVHHDAVEPTCTEEGNIEYWECCGCHMCFTDSRAVNGINSGDVVVSKLGHKLPLAHYEAVEATCQKEGRIEYWQCDRCGYMFSDEDGINRVTDIVVHAGNHMEDGDVYYNTIYHWHQCRWCGIEMEVEPHVWGDWIITLPATEQTKGSKYHVCSVCSYAATEDIPEHDHVPGEILEKHEATCLEGAYYVEKCGNPECGEIVTFPIENEPALGHTGNYIEFRDSSCLEEGVLAHIECSRCGWNVVNVNSTEPMETVVIEKKPHDYSSIWTVEEDKHYHLCKMCGIARIDEEEHVYGEIVDPKYLVTSSTCQHANIYKKSCICGKAGTETFESGQVGEHSYTKYVPVDYQYHLTVCEWCDAILSDSEENHVFNGTVCTKCEYEVITGSGGFTPIITDKRPLAHLEYKKNESGYIFTLINDREEYPPANIRWYLDDKLQEEAGWSFSFDAPYPMTYKVMCIYSNDNGKGSETVVVNGG